MLNDWIHWLSSVPADVLLQISLPVLLFDSVRYAAGAMLWFVWDFFHGGWIRVRRAANAPSPAFCPSVTVVIAGRNESATIGHTLRSLWGTYPRLQILVVDDGSEDRTVEVVRKLARELPGVTLLRRPRRGGKSSALNLALSFVRSDLVVFVDADSHLSENALWHIVQPFADPSVGAVSGCVTVRNPFVNLWTWFQAFEYLQNIFVGRRLAAACNTLDIISGAFGAVRREALERLKGWDVGPGEDGDLALRLRRSGYRIEFAPEANCLTNVPTSGKRLAKQRRRWQWAVITLGCRKHLEMANFRSPNFRLANLLVLADHWIFDILLTYASFGYLAWLLFHWHDDLWKMFLWYYALFAAMQAVQAGVFLFYSTDRRRDARIALITPLMPLYHGWLRCITLWSITEESFTRRSFRDDFVPAHVREASWHW